MATVTADTPGFWNGTRRFGRFLAAEMKPRGKIITPFNVITIAIMAVAASYVAADSNSTSSTRYSTRADPSGSSRWTSSRTSWRIGMGTCSSVFQVPSESERATHSSIVEASN